MVMKIVWFVACLLSWCTAAHAQFNCERLQLLEPTLGSELDEGQPQLSWPGDPKNSVRLQVMVILPEGRILDSVDTMAMGNQWRFPAPITAVRASVKTLISRNCPIFSVQDVSAEKASFFINTQSRCAIDSKSLSLKNNQVRWTLQPQATSYVIRLFELSAKVDDLTTQFVGSYETLVPAWNVPVDMTSAAKLPTTFVATVQSQCQSLQSRPEAIVLSVPN